MVVEGPFDALACIAGGVALTVAINSTRYAHPEHFAGLTRCLIALDADTAGTDALPQWVRALAGYGVATDFLPMGELGEAKDLGEYWQRYGRIPDTIAGYAEWVQGQATYAALPADQRRYVDDLTAILIADGWAAIEEEAADLPDPITGAPDHYRATACAIDRARQALTKRSTEFPR